MVRVRHALLVICAISLLPPAAFFQTAYATIVQLSSQDAPLEKLQYQFKLPEPFKFADIEVDFEGSDSWSRNPVRISVVTDRGKSELDSEHLRQFKAMRELTVSYKHTDLAARNEINSFSVGFYYGDGIRVDSNDCVGAHTDPCVHDSRVEFMAALITFDSDMKQTVEIFDPRMPIDPNRLKDL